MHDEFGSVIEEAITLELNVSDLYFLFYKLFPDDSEFWWKLAMEEQNHAALLKTVKQMSRSELQLPKEIVPSGRNELATSNKKLLQALEDFENYPDRTKAFQFALEIENSAGELHYQSFMKYGTESRLLNVFRKLNGDDINHADRIRQYMNQHNIPEAV
ncbi:MAG: rubrerythrin family protein [Bacteroidota bacterium]